MAPSSDPSPVMLMADADRVTAQAVRVYFERFELQVDCALDHAAAVRLLQAGSYDVVITDLRLSDDSRDDGLAVVSLARDLNPASCIIVLAGSGASPIRAQAHTCGADAFLHKPQHLAELKRTIDELRSGATGAACGHNQPAGASAHTETNSSLLKAVMP